MMVRCRKRTSITRGGCDRCTANWRGENAHMLAARHHELTGHPTWSQTSGGNRHRYEIANQQERLL